METVLGLVFSKFGGILVALLGALGVLLWGKYQKSRAEMYKDRLIQARATAEENARVVEAHEKIQEAKDEINPELKKTDAQVAAGDDAGLAGDLSNLGGVLRKPGVDPEGR